jgi:cell division protein FtsB
MSLTQTTSPARRARIDGAERKGSGQLPLPEPVQRGPIRPFLRRWLAASMLLGAALLAVLYISNAIAVNDLLSDIASLEHDRDLARADNEKLRAELLRLMSVERVTSLASSRLGMVQPAQPPQMMGAAAPGRRPGPAVDSATVGR